jgi:hypothetical protein
MLFVLDHYMYVIVSKKKITICNINSSSIYKYKYGSIVVKARKFVNSMIYVTTNMVLWGFNYTLNQL